LLLNVAQTRGTARIATAAMPPKNVRKCVMRTVERVRCSRKFVSCKVYGSQIIECRRGRRFDDGLIGPLATAQTMQQAPLPSSHRRDPVLSRNSQPPIE